MDDDFDYEEDYFEEEDELYGINGFNDEEEEDSEDFYENDDEDY